MLVVMYFVVSSNFIEYKLFLMNVNITNLNLISFEHPSFSPIFLPVFLPSSVPLPLRPCYCVRIIRRASRGCEVVLCYVILKYVL